MKIQKVRWIALWVMTFLIISCAIIPADRLPADLETYKSSLVHIGFYFILTFIALRTFQFTQIIWLQSRPLFMAALYNLLVGTFAEWLQFFVPGRMSDVMDLIMNAIGVFLALCGVVLLRKFTQPT